MNVALYHRVSTVDQDPTLAREELRALARRLGAVVVLDVEETGSGARNDRPGLQQVMGAARRGQLDAVLVWKVDRFGRSTLDLLSNVQELDARKVRFVSATQSIDTGGPSGRLTLTILAAVAEYEREIIRERTRLGLAKARRDGTKLGRRERLSRKAIEAAFAWWTIEGMSPRQIAARLVEKKMVTKDKRGRWPSHAAVFRSLERTKRDHEKAIAKPAKKARA